MINDLTHEMSMTASRDERARKSFVSTLRGHVLVNMADAMHRHYHETVAPRYEREHGEKPADGPTVRKLDSVDRFDTLRARMLLGSDTPPPFQYIEIIELNDFDRFREEVATEAMQRVAGEFRGFAKDPQFVVCELLDGDTA